MPEPSHFKHTQSTDFIARMGDRFGRQAVSIIRFRWFVVVGVALVTVAMMPGALRLQRNDLLNSWLLDNDPLSVAQEKFARTFGNNDYVLVLVEADDVFSHDVLVMLRELGERLERSVPYADRAVSISALEFATRDRFGFRSRRLVPEPVPSDPARLEAVHDAAMQRPSVVGRLFSEDGTQALLVLQLKDYPDDRLTDSEHQSRVAHAVRDVLSDDRFAGFRVTAGGMPILNTEMTEWLNHESPRLFVLTLAAMILVLAVLFRSVRCVVAPILTAVISSVWVFGLMGFTGVGVQSVVEIVPLVLVLVVSIGYSIHVLSFFRDRFAATGERAHSIAYALRHAGWPVLFTVITTVLGLASFAVVRVSAVRWVGLVSAGLVLCAYPLVIALTPAILSFGADRETSCRAGRHRADWAGDLLARLSDWVLDHGRVIVVVFAVALGVFALLTTGLEVTTDSIKSMGRQVPYIQRSYHISEGIGSLHAYDVIVAFPDSGAALSPMNVSRLECLATEIEQAGHVKRTTSIAHILKEVHQVATGGDAKQFTLPADRSHLVQLIVLYEAAGAPESERWVGNEGRVLRLSVELERYSTGEMIPHLRSVSALARETFPEAQVDLVGMSVRFAQMMDEIVRGQILSVLAALVSISIVLMLALGSVRLGLVAMIPNIAPVVFVAGTMAALDIPLHQATVIVAPLIIGIAVDDTIHYITHFRVAFHHSGSYREASRETFRAVGKAIFMTSLVVIIGVAVLTTSAANAYRHIGLATMVGVAAALAADCFVTPTLMRCLKVFGPER